jgi:DNA processing protein
MAVPGSPSTGKSGGCHRLIQAGAALVEGAADVFAELGIVAMTTPEAGAPLDRWTARVLALVGEEFTALDDLVEGLDLPVEQVLETLVHLELDGFVERLDGGYIRRPR